MVDELIEPISISERHGMQRTAFLNDVAKLTLGNPSDDIGGVCILKKWFTDATMSNLVNYERKRV